MNIKQKIVFGFLVLATLLSIVHFLTLQKYEHLYHSLQKKNQLELPLLRVLEKLSTLLQHLHILLKSEYPSSLLLKHWQNVEKDLVLWKSQYQFFAPVYSYQDSFTISQQYKELYRLVFRILQLKKEQKHTLLLFSKKLCPTSPLLSPLSFAYFTTIYSLKLWKKFQALQSQIYPQIRKLSLLQKKISPHIQKLTHRYQNVLKQKENQINQYFQQTNFLSAIAIVAVTLLALLLGLFASHRIASPIIELEKATRFLGEGNLQTRVPVQGKDEIASLTKSFNKMAEELSQKTVSTSYMDRILNTMPDALFVLNSEGKIQRLNQATLSLLQYQNTELLNQPIQTILVEHQLANPQNPYSIYNHDIQSLETSFITKNKEKVPVLFSSKRMEQQVIAVAQNISQLKQLQKEILNIAEREQQRLGQDLHDGIGQQLTGIAFLAKSLAQKLKEQHPSQAKIAEQINSLINEVIKDTRNLAKGLYPIELQQNGLQDAVDEFAQNLQKLFHIQCQTHWKTQNTPPPDQAIHLYRIIQEACHNALKHGKATKITISLHQDKQNSYLTIQDNGKGIPPQLLTQKKYLGLGLHTMHYRAKIIGGHLEIHSAPQGLKVLCIYPTKTPSNSLINEITNNEKPKKNNKKTSPPS